MAGTAETANVTIKLVRDRDFDRTIAKFYGNERAREIRSSLDPQCLSGFRKNEKFEIEHSDVFLTVDNGDFIFLDCAYEELLQSLGPINDTSSVPWTMFNDNVQMGFFDVYDQYILNILYDPRIKAGMTVQEVKAVMPQVSMDVRAWVSKDQQPAAESKLETRHLRQGGLIPAMMSFQRSPCKIRDKRCHRTRYRMRITPSRDDGNDPMPTPSSRTARARSACGGFRWCRRRSRRAWRRAAGGRSGSR